MVTEKKCKSNRPNAKITENKVEQGHRHVPPPTFQNYV